MRPKGANDLTQSKCEWHGDPRFVDKEPKIAASPPIVSVRLMVSVLICSLDRKDYIVQLVVSWYTPPLSGFHCHLRQNYLITCPFNEDTHSTRAKNIVLGRTRDFLPSHVSTHFFPKRDSEGCSIFASPKVWTFGCLFWCNIAHFAFFTIIEIKNTPI